MSPGREECSAGAPVDSIGGSAKLEARADSNNLQMTFEVLGLDELRLKEISPSQAAKISSHAHDKVSLTHNLGSSLAPPLLLSERVQINGEEGGAVGSTDGSSVDQQG